MKDNELLIRAIFLIVSLLLVGGIIYLIFSFRTGQQENNLTVGAVFIGMNNDNGWNQSHYNGIKKACEAYDCEMYVQTSVSEEERALGKAISILVRKGCNCIFLTSYGYGAYLENIAKENPDVAFYSISGESNADNCASYFARMYQARYLSGIVAGAASKSNKLAYVAAMAVPETVRSIDAYALGARMANPDAKVIVKYTGSWNNKEKEEEASRELIAAGADVVTFHEDRPYAINLADDMGVCTTGYDYVSREYSDKFLTAALFDWGIIYSKVLNDYMGGRANFSKNYWLSLSDGAVSLYPYSPLVTQETRELVKREKKRIQTQRDVFSGEIYDNEGKLRCRKDERISDYVLYNTINWYVEGVEINE